MRLIINDDLQVSKHMVNLGAPQPGSFNVLNIPDRLFVDLERILGEDGFWNRVNAPFLDAAIQRGDDIALATTPNYDPGGNMLKKDGGLTGFWREVKYLELRGYYFDSKTGRMVKE